MRLPYLFKVKGRVINHYFQLARIHYLSQVLQLSLIHI